MMLLLVQGIFLPLVMIGGAATGAAPPSVDGRPDASPIGPSISISLAPDTLLAHVTEKDSGPAMFNGTASVDRIVRGVRVTVTLSAACEWPAILSPSTMVFTTGDPQTFYVTVVVPPATERDISNSVVVSASGKAPGLPVMTAQAEATVTVAPYYKAHLALPLEAVEARRGSTTSVKCNLSNSCNGPMSFQVQLVGPVEGITLHPINSISLKQFDVVDIELAFDVASDFPTGSRSLELQVTFLQAEPGTPASTQQMAVNVVPGLGRSGAPVLIAAIVAAISLGIIGYWVVRGRRRASGH